MAAATLFVDRHESTVNESGDYLMALRDGAKPEIRAEIGEILIGAAKGRTSNFARFHAAQALNLFVVIFTGTLIAFLLAYFKGPGWLPLVFAVLAADCFAVIKAAIGANRCEWYRLPAIVAWPIFR